MMYEYFCSVVLYIFKQHYYEKNCWNVLIWVTGHCNRALYRETDTVLKKLLILIKY